jgi:hypothetical protein
MSHELCVSLVHHVRSLTARHIAACVGRPFPGGRGRSRALVGHGSDRSVRGPAAPEPHWATALPGGPCPSKQPCRPDQPRQCCATVRTCSTCVASRVPRHARRAAPQAREMDGHVWCDAYSIGGASELACPAHHQVQLPAPRHFNLLWRVRPLAG